MNKLTFLQPVSIRGKIRLGEKRDGGYIIYDKLLPKTDVLLSYGVGWEISFEEDFNRRTNKKVLMFDPTMFGKYIMNFNDFKNLLISFRIGAAFKYLYATWELWRKKKQLEAKNIFFVNEGIAKTRSPQYDTLASHLERFNLQKSSILLKMDIEASEYAVFEDNNVYQCFQHVTQIVIEFHDLKNRIHDLKEIINKLGKDFVLVHIHANNFSETFRLYDFLNDPGDELIVPDVIEVLFVKKDAIEKEDLVEEKTAYPIPGLDYPNNPRKEDHAINFF